MGGWQSLLDASLRSAERGFDVFTNHNMHTEPTSCHKSCGSSCVQVRIAALNGLVAWCELLPHEARVAHLLPLVRQHMQPLELELPLQRTLAAAFPRLLAAVSSKLMSCTTAQAACTGCQGRSGLCRTRLTKLAKIV